MRKTPSTKSLPDVLMNDEERMLSFQREDEALSHFIYQGWVADDRTAWICTLAILAVVAIVVGTLLGVQVGLIWS
jgi:hypothetical protein